MPRCFFCRARRLGISSETLRVVPGGNVRDGCVCDCLRLRRIMRRCSAWRILLRRIISRWIASAHCRFRHRCSIGATRFALAMASINRNLICGSRSRRRFEFRPRFSHGRFHRARAASCRRCSSTGHSRDFRRFRPRWKMAEHLVEFSEDRFVNGRTRRAQSFYISASCSMQRATLIEQGFQTNAMSLAGNRAHSAATSGKARP